MQSSVAQCDEIAISLIKHETNKTSERHRDLDNERKTEPLAFLGTQETMHV